MSQHMTDVKKVSNSETVTIDRDVYDSLMHDHIWLIALQSAGVDCWEGYDSAQEIFNELNDE